MATCLPVSGRVSSSQRGSVSQSSNFPIFSESGQQERVASHASPATEIQQRGSNKKVISIAIWRREGFDAELWILYISMGNFDLVPFIFFLLGSAWLSNYKVFATCIRTFVLKRIHVCTHEIMVVYGNDAIACNLLSSTRSQHGSWCMKMCPGRVSLGVFNMRQQFFFSWLCLPPDKIPTHKVPAGKTFQNFLFFHTFTSQFLSHRF